ncbi:PucR family transcriptional regulator [Solirubrobacter soli]|uniref:PucR family transcriptional regulator n=1 Tax=Solirubrobacter soli TaxID=363832 RepID=UPI0004172D26|nr:helix-turn-helix domain-containing protein [Solirubrobacter soli]
MADLQEIVDDLEAEIRRPISVEDRRWRLLAHSAQPDEADAVRRSSILTRETSPDVIAWLDGLGLQRARDLVDLPRNDALGMTRRGCLPIRHGEVLLGFLWVIVGDHPLTDAEKQSLKRGGEEVAANLWARHRAADERLRRTREHLTALFHGATGAAADLAAILRWPVAGSYAVVVCAGTDQDAEKLRRSRAAHDVAYLEHGDTLTILVRDPAQLKGSLNVRNGGISSSFTQLSDAPKAREQAEIAALCARAQLGPVAAYDELGSWAPIAELWTRTHHATPTQIQLLATHRRGDQLLEALEGLLEHGGDVAEAAKRLNMHRATLYRRLERVEEITGLDLQRGDDRLLAHLGLRLLKLNATTVAPPPR